MSHAAGRPSRGGMGVPIGAAALLGVVLVAASLGTPSAVLERLGGPAQPLVAQEQRSQARVAPTVRGASARPVKVSVAAGLPFAGHLIRGVQLPSAGIGFVSWDAILQRSPNRGWRRFSTDRMINFVERLGAEWQRAHPDAPRLLIGDLSRTHGGPFGSSYGGLGHGSHQNGLDADIYYPRADGRERAVTRVSQIDHRLAQDLVDRIVRRGVQYAFVGPHTGLKGPKGVVITLVHHDDHVHVRIWNYAGRQSSAQPSGSRTD
jgi:Penicillin-insensitive murein endopeptidase